MPREGRKLWSGNSLQGQKKPQKRMQLLVASKLADDQIKEVIRCYAYDRSPAEAQKLTGLSHVTVYRLYGHIRKRLFHLGLFRSKIAFIDDMNDWEEEGREHFDWGPFEDALRRWLGRHRGIDASNRDLYVAEAIFRIQDNHFKPAQLYGLILKAVEGTGPLNRPPLTSTAAIFYQEQLRLNLMFLRSLARAYPLPGLKTLLVSGADWMEKRMTPVFVEITAQERRLRKRRQKKLA